tara:strand:- start:7140 stop:7406 length:267 start_codon:yes stop_codon:yes gene_type:complete
MVVFKIPDLILEYQRETGQTITHDKIADAVDLHRTTVAKIASPRKHYNTTIDKIEQVFVYFYNLFKDSGLREITISDFLDVRPETKAA